MGQKNVTAQVEAQQERRVGILFLAILLPPVAVYMMAGPQLQFWCNVLLTVCGYVPGVIHAVFVFLKSQSRRR